MRAGRGIREALRGNFGNDGGVRVAALPLGEYADLYEKDRRKFEIQRETAARVLMGSDTGATDLMDRYLAEEHGQAAVDSIQRRVAELRTKRRSQV